MVVTVVIITTFTFIIITIIEVQGQCDFVAKHIDIGAKLPRFEFTSPIELCDLMQVT